MPQPKALSDHAIRRYLQRWRPNWTYADAKRELESILPRTRFVEDEPPHGEIWEAPNGMRLGVRRDGTVATVLPMGAIRTRYRPRKAKGRR